MLTQFHKKIDMQKMVFVYLYIWQQGCTVKFTGIGKCNSIEQGWEKEGWEIRRKKNIIIKTWVERKIEKVSNN